MMKKLISALTLIVATGMAQAGSDYSAEVYVGSDRASGSLLGAHDSADTTQYIQCRIYDGGLGRCEARDAGGQTGSCMTSEDRYLKMIRSLSPASNLWFRWDSNGNCTYLYIQHSSQHIR